MKKIVIVVFLIMLSMIMSACSSDESVETEIPSGTIFKEIQVEEIIVEEIQVEEIMVEEIIVETII